MTKEQRRLQMARKKRMQAKLAKGTVIGLLVLAMPIMAYLIIEG